MKNRTSFTFSLCTFPLLSYIIRAAKEKEMSSMYADYHMHTSFSSDSEAPMEHMILSAIHKNVPGICFTEHMDFDFPPGEFDFFVDMPSYQQKLMELREKYKDKIEINFGIELGLQPHLTGKLPSFAASYPFDFVIGSVHVADGCDPYDRIFFDNRSEEEAYRSYFTCLLENLKVLSCFDVCGHIDYVVRYGPNRNLYYSYEKYRDILDEILHVLVQKGIGLECNTAGFKYGLGHPNPTEKILIRYRELGGEILTLGSDAHAPEHIAYDFERAGTLLKEYGFQYYTVFKNRKPEFLPL